MNSMGLEYYLYGVYEFVAPLLNVTDPLYLIIVPNDDASILGVIRKMVLPHT